MSNIELSFDKPIQIFTINGKNYEVFYDDDALNRYVKVLSKFTNENDALKEVDFQNISFEEQETIREKQTKMVSEFFSEVFGAGAYDEIYNSIGRSMFNMVHVIEAFSDWLETKVAKFQEEKSRKAAYYTKR